MFSISSSNIALKGFIHDTNLYMGADISDLEEDISIDKQKGAAKSCVPCEFSYSICA
jgi:hypothetical protein